MKVDSFAQQQLHANVQNQAQASRGPQYQPGFMADLAGSPGGAQPRSKTPLAHMSELDRFGLPGLLEMIRNENSDVSSLAIGQDLTTLGLDLNSSE